MKLFHLLGVIAPCVLLIASCMGPPGPDGKDGQAYLTVASNYGVIYSYSDNNFSRLGGSSVFNIGQAYAVSPGVYSFQYQSRIYNLNGSYFYTNWSGQYVIWQNLGEKGGPGKILWERGDPGSDGLDSYLTLYCNYDGPTQSRLNKQDWTNPPLPDSTAVTESQSGGYSIRAEYHLLGHGVVQADEKNR
jgi:hypothetical protein